MSPESIVIMPESTVASSSCASGRVVASFVRRDASVWEGCRGAFVEQPTTKNETIEQISWRVTTAPIAREKSLRRDPARLVVEGRPKDPPKVALTIRP